VTHEQLCATVGHGNHRTNVSSHLSRASTFVVYMCTMQDGNSESGVESRFPSNPQP
jgi:hypothetical protein